MTTQLIVARLRVTLDCPECASPIPVNGVVPAVLCHACHTVVELKDDLGWDKITTYARGEGCLAFGPLRVGPETRALDYFLALHLRSDRPNRLYRSHRGILLEVDEQPPRCLECGNEHHPATLLGEVQREEAPSSFWPCRFAGQNTSASGSTRR